MPTRINDLFVYALLIGVLFLAFFGIQGCAASPPPRPQAWYDRVDLTAAVMLDGDGYRCSGVAIGDHEVLTAAHCVDRGPLDAYAFPGEIARPVLSFEKDREGKDLALVRLGGPKLTVQVRYAPPGELQEGDVVFAAGFGCYGTLAPAPGLYVGVRPQDGDLVFAMGVCPGDSGGPVLDDQGRLVGILSAKGVNHPLGFAEDVR